jgi:hypothetical protein
MLQQASCPIVVLAASSFRPDTICLRNFDIILVFLLKPGGRALSTGGCPSSTTLPSSSPLAEVVVRNPGDAGGGCHFPASWRADFINGY